MEISSFIVVYRWSGPTEEQRKMAVENWKKMIEIAVDMNVPVINTEFSGDRISRKFVMECGSVRWKNYYRSSKKGLRVEVQSHPYDFLN